MKLRQVEIKNYRSVFAGKSGKAERFDLADGMNAFIGPNNCGKSNIIRAIALALDRDSVFRRSIDIPGPMRHAVPRVTLEFIRTKTSGPEDTLFRYCEEYEQSLQKRGAQATYAGDDIIRYQVSYPGNEQSGATRQDIIVARGAGARRGDQALLERALGQFQKVVRFVWLESGTDLEDLLRGKFREILHTVIGEHLADELSEAQDRHKNYIQGLQDDLLRPLSSIVQNEVSGLFREIGTVELVPGVPDVSSTLEDIEVHLEDSVRTPIGRKGTGVRGGVLVAMMRYLAENSRRSLVMAVEEPEAFLHPGAQEGLREDLEDLAARDDVTLLVTSHSPFVISKRSDSLLIQIEKDGSGRTSIASRATGQDSHELLLGTLFRDPGHGSILDRMTRVPTDANGIVFVEGTTDFEYLMLASELATKNHLVEDLHIVPCVGAADAAVQAVVMRQQTDLPVLVLLDSDDEGKRSYDLLTDGSKFKFDKKKEVMSYSDALGFQRDIVVEAEDLWPYKLLQQFISEFGEEEVLSEKLKWPGSKGWHLGFNKLGKELLPTWLREHAEEDDAVLALECLTLLRAKMSLTDAQ